MSAAWAAGVCGGSPAGTSWVASATPTGSGARGRRAALQGLAQTCNLKGFIELTGVADPSSVGTDGSEDDGRGATGHAHSMLLLAACRAAIQHGISRVVWPIHVGSDEGGGTRGTDAPSGRALHDIADACDRAMLAGQLASIDAGRNAQGVVIELPYVDFSDAQLMELSIDMGVPLASSWYCESDGAGACGVCGECVRWQKALSAVSPGATLVQVVAGRRHERAEK